MIRQEEMHMKKDQIHIEENDPALLDPGLLAILLKDRSSGKNILWAADNYAHKGAGFQRRDCIEIFSITGGCGQVVRPRAVKSRKEQFARIRQNAEVFTPTWICNKQNNLVDRAWFGADGVFNVEHGRDWTATSGRVPFPTPAGKTWEDYVGDTRLEITCGEAPYLASRYDPVTGGPIELSRRVGLLDRKMRVVAENTDTEAEWRKWARIAFQSIYGYDWQGDNVLLARENLLLSYVDYYRARFEKAPEAGDLREIAEILSWNIWQMDGLKFVIPDSCQAPDDGQLGLFENGRERPPCEGCAKNDPLRHRGIYCRIKDWKTNRTVKFVSLLKGKVGK